MSIISTLVQSGISKKLKHIWQIFKLDFLGNETSYEKIRFHIFIVFFHVESANCTQLRHQLRIILNITYGTCCTEMYQLVISANWQLTKQLLLHYDILSLR